MRPWPSWLAPLYRALGRQVDHLRSTLDHLTERLRDNVVQVVGEAVSRAVKEVFRVVLGVPTTPWPAHEYNGRPRSSYWNDRQHDDWYGGYHDDRDDREDYDREPSYQDSAPSSSWASALVTGLHIAAWTLERARRLSVSVGAGLAAALALSAGSPWLATATALVGSLVVLTS